MRAVVIGLIPCWMSVDSFNVSSLYILVTLHAVATAVFGPALTAAVPSLVVPSQYTSANALLQITTSLGIIFGPALSGLGIAALSSQEVLCLNALTYLISAACFVPIRFAPPILSLVSQSPIASTWRDIVDGVRYVMTGRRIIIFLTITASLYTFATSAFTTLFPVFARTLLDLGPVEVGYLWSMLGVGLLSVSVALTIISAWSIKRRIKVIAVRQHHERPRAPRPGEDESADVGCRPTDAPRCRSGGPDSGGVGRASRSGSSRTCSDGSWRSIPLVLWRRPWLALPCSVGLQENSVCRLPS